MPTNESTQMEELQTNIDLFNNSIITVTIAH